MPKWDVKVSYTLFVQVDYIYYELRQLLQTSQYTQADFTGQIYSTCLFSQKNFAKFLEPSRPPTLEHACCIHFIAVVIRTIYFIPIWQYSSPSLSGHSNQRPLSMWPKFFGTATINIVLPFTKGHLSTVAASSQQIGWHY